MPLTVNVHEAKTHFSKLLARVAAGEEVIIAKAGKPIARLSHFSPAKPSREPGWAKGMLKIAADFDAPMSPEELADWYDGAILP